MSCLFCKIVNKELNAEIVYQDDYVTGFKDIHPLAKIHLLFVHKNHNTNVNHMINESPNDLVQIFQAIAHYTQAQKLDENGFRVFTNLGKDAGQTVFHTHFHLLAGEKLRP